MKIELLLSFVILVEIITHYSSYGGIMINSLYYNIALVLNLASSLVVGMEDPNHNSGIEKQPAWDDSFDNNEIEKQLNEHEIFSLVDMKTYLTLQKKLHVILI